MPAMKDLVNGVPTAIAISSMASGPIPRSRNGSRSRIRRPVQVIATVPKGSADDADRALVAAAYQAQPAWEALPPIERAASC